MSSERLIDLTVKKGERSLTFRNVPAEVRFHPDGSSEEFITRSTYRKLRDLGRSDAETDAESRDFTCADDPPTQSIVATLAFELKRHEPDAPIHQLKDIIDRLDLAFGSYEYITTTINRNKSGSFIVALCTVHNRSTELQNQLSAFVRTLHHLHESAQPDHIFPKKMLRFVESTYGALWCLSPGPQDPYESVALCVGSEYAALTPDVRRLLASAYASVQAPASQAQRLQSDVGVLTGLYPNRLFVIRLSNQRDLMFHYSLAIDLVVRRSVGARVLVRHFSLTGDQGQAEMAFDIEALGAVDKD